MQALWMILAALLFSTMAVGVKFASADFSTAQIVCYRGIIGVVCIAGLMRAQGIRFRTPVFKMHLGRSIAGVLSLGGWFYAIAHLPLATAMTLNYMSSLWVAAFVVGSAMLYGQAQRQGALLATVLLGFVGVVLTLRPAIDKNQLFAGLVGLIASLFAALAYVQVSALGKAGEPEARTVFYFSAVTALAGGLCIPLFDVTPLAQLGWHAWGWVLAVGVLAALAQLCLTRAYSQGPTLVVANLQYSGIVFGALYSLLLFGEQLVPMGWTGIAMIVVCGVAATALRAR